MHKFKQNKILILGGTGFIGYHLAKKSKLKGFIITCVSRNIPSKEKIIPKIKYKKLNLESYKNLKKLKKNYDYIINASGYINNNSKLKYRAHNLKIVKNVFSYFKDSNLKAFVNIGSSAEYGGVSSPQIETLKCVPKTKYGLDKLKCTKFLIRAFKRFKFPSIIFRVYQVYGPLQDTNRLIPIAAKACFLNKEFHCSDENQVRDYIYIDDLIEAIMKSLNNKQAIGQIFNLGSGRKTSIKYIIYSVRKYFKKGTPIFGKKKLRKDENKLILANITKAKKILKWKPKILFKEGLVKTLKFFEKKLSTQKNFKNSIK